MASPLLLACSAAALATSALLTIPFAHAEPAHFDFSYQVEIPKPASPFKRLRVWIPMPSQGPDQKIFGQKITTRLPYTITVEKKLGNTMAYFEITDPSKLPAQIRFDYEVRRDETVIRPPGSAAHQEHWDPKAFLAMDRKVPITGVIAEIATSQVQGAGSEDEKIRKLYQYTVETMTYNKDGTGWGQGDAVWACTNKRGNCTDFHSLLIGMARSQKIAGKFEIGFPLPPSGQTEIPGDHCWAHLYSKVRGWIPVDASEAKKAGKMFEYFGHLPSDRIQFTAGRDLVLEPRQDGEPLNYFIYPYAELDGQVLDGLKKRFEAHRLN